MTITFQQEFMATAEREMRALIEDHWREIALNQERIKLNPDWEAYAELDASGVMKIFTARDDGALVGYFVVFCRRHIHYVDHIFAHNDIIYLRPEYRRGMVGARLIKFAEKCLADDGVSVLLINTKAHKPFDGLLERLGFGLAERVYSKFIRRN